MKTKRIMKAGFISFISLLFTFLILISCQKESDKDTINDLTFLYIESSALESGLQTGSFSSEDWNIIGLAFERINIISENGLKRIEQRSGSEVNISEELFDFLTTIINNTNDLIRLKKIDISITRLRKWDEGQQDPPTDCVAQEIYAAVSSLGGYTSLQQITNWINSTYGGDGVPIDYFGDAISHFLTGFTTYYPPSQFEPSSGETWIIAIVMGGEGHAGTLLYVYGQNVVYWDHQNNTIAYATYINCPRAYKVTGLQ